MNVSGHLYQLIHTLTKSERRYFKLHAGFNRKDSHLLQLFEAITQNDITDDQSLKLHLADVAFVSQLDVLKVHLSQLILSVMRNFHRNGANNQILSDLITDLNYLHNKGLDASVVKLLKKAKGMAIEINHDTALIEILAIENKMLSNFPKAINLQTAVANVAAEEQAAIDRLQITADLKALENKSRRLIAAFKAKPNNAHYRQVLQLIDSSTFVLPETATARHKYLYYNIKLSISNSLNDEEAAVIIRGDLINLHLTYPFLIKDDPIEFAEILTSQVNSYYRLNNISAAKATFEMIIQIPLQLSKSQRRSKELLRIINEKVATLQGLMDKA
jgi:hypothetical protein